MGVSLERVNHGNWLVDCDACGTVGVWPGHAQAVAAKQDHLCGQPSRIAGRVKPTLIVGDGPRGQEAERD